MKKIFFLILAFTTIQTRGQSRVIKEIDAFMRAEESAWNSGSHIAYVDLYLDDPETRMITKKGVVKGKQAILAYYQKYFPTGQMGTLSLEYDAVEKINTSTYYVTGFFHLIYPDGKKVDGRYSSLMKKVKGTWYLYTDHSS